MSLAKAAQMSFSDIVRNTLFALHTNDKTLVQSLVCLSVLPKSESSTLHLLAITTAGVCYLVCMYIYEISSLQRSLCRDVL